MSKSYQSIRGTHDFNPSETLQLNAINALARALITCFAYEEINLPLLEDQNVFIRGLGQITDIVEKQMFKIQDKEIVLRPEGTAQVIRYYLDNSLYRQNDLVKLFYLGPMFRGERPQKGRLRQFHHIGVEAIGSSSIYLDLEVIDLALKLLFAIGVSEYELKINTLGCAQDKLKFAQQLKENLTNRVDQLCLDCQTRLNKNPLRIIDCKERQCKQLVASLNLSETSLCLNCKERFEQLLKLLTDLGVKYNHDHYLVRGLDYYTATVFEITSSSLGSQDALGAGGRYDNLVSDLGGPQIPAMGFALGVERLLLALAQAELKQPSIELFVVVLNQEYLGFAYKLLAQVRSFGVAADIDYNSRSLKAQLRSAQKKNAKFVAIVGENEIKDNSVMLKNMATANQKKVKVEQLTELILSKGEIC